MSFSVSNRRRARMSIKSPLLLSSAARDPSEQLLDRRRRTQRYLLAVGPGQPRLQVEAQRGVPRRHRPGGRDGPPLRPLAVGVAAADALPAADAAARQQAAPDAGPVVATTTVVQPWRSPEF